MTKNGRWLAAAPRHMRAAVLTKQQAKKPVTRSPTISSSERERREVAVLR